jgi:hypothetical protein
MQCRAVGASFRRLYSGIFRVFHMPEDRIQRRTMGWRTDPAGPHSRNRLTSKTRQAFLDNFNETP